MIAGIVVAVIAVGFGAFANQLSSQFNLLGDAVECGSGNVPWQSSASGGSATCISNTAAGIEQQADSQYQSLFNQYDQALMTGNYGALAGIDNQWNAVYQQEQSLLSALPPQNNQPN